MARSRLIFFSSGRSTRSKGSHEQDQISEDSFYLFSRWSSLLLLVASQRGGHSGRFLDRSGQSGANTTILHGEQTRDGASTWSCHRVLDRCWMCSRGEDHPRSSLQNYRNKQSYRKKGVFRGQIISIGRLIVGWYLELQARLPRREASPSLHLHQPMPRA